MQFHQHFGHVLTFRPLLLLCLEHSSQMFASFISTNVTFSPGPSYEKFGTSILHIYPTPYFSSAHSLRLFATPVDCSTPGFPVQHRLPELAQTHIHWAGDAITISSSSIPVSSCLQSFSASGSFSISQFFALGGQSIGVSASASILPMNIQEWFPLRLTGWISLKSKGLSSAFSNITVQKHQFFGAQLSLQSNSHIHTWLL